MNQPFQNPHILTATFDIPILPGQIHHFRKAVAQVVEQELKLIFEHMNIPTWLFHHHDPITGKTMKETPLIQFKMYGRGKHTKYAQITGIAKGAEALYLFLKYKPAFIQFYGLEKPIPFTLLHEPAMQVLQMEPSPIPQLYQINYWLPLDTNDHEQWLDNKKQPLAEKLPALENNLRENIYRLCRAAGQWFPETLDIHITEILHSSHRAKMHTHNGTLTFFTMDVRFTANILLPPHICIGKGSAVGFGKITAVPITGKKRIDRRRSAAIEEEAAQ